MDLTAISSKTTFRELNIRGHFDGSADRASLPGCLSLDAELYRKENPDQDTPASSMQILEDNLELCVEAMLRFWQGPGEERGIQPFHLALHPPVYTCDQAPTFVSHLFGSDKFGLQAARFCGPSRHSGAAEMKNVMFRDIYCCMRMLLEKA